MTIPAKYSISRIIFYILSITLGLLFLFSAFSKTIPISLFIDNIYNRFSITYQAASLLARFIIGFEAGLGVLLIIGLYGKWRWVLYSVFGLLVAFTAFILVIWIQEGNEADCGCMGEMVKLNPMWSVIKNILMLAMVVILIVKDRKKETTSRYYFAWIIPVIFICYPFIFVPGELGIDKMYAVTYNDSLTAPPVDLRDGKHIVAFMSLTCSHCREAAAKFARMKKEDPDMPVIFIFSGKADQYPDILKDFLSETQSGQIQRHFIPKSIFRELAGRGVPSIFMLNGTEIEDKIDNYKNMSVKRLKDWYQGA
ncbi:MAG: hypothetical protein KL787_05840 [Taibaiella sp.]|nr:hypothetical protein [Taibaiella sp.]